MKTILKKQRFSNYRYILFTLFINKYLRKSISNILNKKKEYYSLINNTQFIGPVINAIRPTEIFASMPKPIESASKVIIVSIDAFITLL